MHSKMKTLGTTAVLLTLSVTPLLATEPGRPDPAIGSVRFAAGHVQQMLVKAAGEMSEDDYAFKPTPEVRGFGQLIAHIADANYGMCSLAKGETPPASGIEKSKTAKADIQRALAESFAYCAGAWDAMTGPRAKTTVEFMGLVVPAPTMLDFATYHNLSHYGNVVVYMRLRGRVPPSSQPGAPGAPPATEGSPSGATP